MKIAKNILPWIALVVAFVSAYYAYSGNQTAMESNKIANEALEVSRNSFLAEKRPYLNVYIPKYNESNNYIGIFDSEEGPKLAHRLEIKNEGGIAARNIKVTLYRLESSQKGAVQTVYIELPDLQKILPGKSTYINTSFGDILSESANSIINEASLTFQAQVQYKSDVDESIQYETIKQFSVTKDKITLMGNLGEFR